MNKSPLTIAACAVLALAGSAVTAVEIAGVAGDGATEQHVVRDPVHTVVIDAEDGDVTLEHTSRQVRVRVDRDHLINTPDASETVADGVLTLKTRCPIGFVRCRSDYRVAVPPGVVVRVEKPSGRVDARGIGGGVTRLHEGTGPLVFTAA